MLSSRQPDSFPFIPVGGLCLLSCLVLILLGAAPAGALRPPAQTPSRLEQPDWLREARAPLSLARKDGRGGWRQYDRMPQEDQERLQRKYEQWQHLPPQKKEMLRRRQERWEKLSPRERELYRQRYRQLQDLPPGERRRIQRELRNWESLSPEEKERIRRRFENRR